MNFNGVGKAARDHLIGMFFVLVLLDTDFGKQAAGVVLYINR